MGYQDFCKQFEGVCQEYGRAEANRMFEDEPFLGCFGNPYDDEEPNTTPAECCGCDNDCNMCHYYHEREE